MFQTDRVMALLMLSLGRYDSVVSRSGADAYVSKQEISTGLVRTIREAVNRGSDGTRPIRAGV